MRDGMASGGRDAGAIAHAPFVIGEEPGAIVAGFDVHRRQITVDALDTATGEVSRGQIESTPTAVEEWVEKSTPPDESSELSLRNSSAIRIGLISEPRSNRAIIAVKMRRCDGT